MENAAAAAASSNPAIPPSTFLYQPEMMYEGAYEMPPQHQSHGVEAPHQFMQQQQSRNNNMTPIPFPVIMTYPYTPTMTVTPSQQVVVSPPYVCQICGGGDTTTKRLCVFAPNGFTQAHSVIHVFCGKTAAILPNINRPDLEILTKSGIKKKLGTGPAVVVALQQRARKAIVDETEYYLIQEVEAHVHQISAQYDPSIPVELVPSTYSGGISSTTSTPTYTNPRPTPETMEAFKKIQPPQMPTPLDTLDSTSPPRKKLKHTTTTTKSPYELLMEKLQHKSDEIGGVGYSLVRGVSPACSEGDYDEQEEENFDPRRCSQTQVDHVRILIVTKARQGLMEHMANLVSSRASESELALQVWDMWHMFQSKYRNIKCWKNKLNMILGFTDAIKDYDGWMHSTEYPWDQLTLGLARLWKSLLKKSPEELGVDVEFTLLGIMCLLQDFQEQVESVETTKMEFPYLSKDNK